MIGSDPCVFCAIARGESRASIVCENSLSVCFVDMRQYHPGHVLVIPRSHLADIRDLDEAHASSLMSMAARVSRAVARAFPNQGLSVWHSIGPAAHQEVPHLHLHIHPRQSGDGMLQVYPEAPPLPDRRVLDQHAMRLRALLERL